ncbi:MAG: ribose 5-phosphate isomerase B [Deltaproteobacteria bacterium]|nr:ribose 5-phosphate isomerase B [Deltaproteobacteria bacterium]
MAGQENLSKAPQMTNEAKKIIIGSDHAGYAMKEIVKRFLLDQDMEVKDVGTDGEASVDYTDFGIKVAGSVSAGEFQRGILVCGTGIGMSMVANRFKGVRAALANDLFSAIMSRRHNNSNILVMGGRVIGDSLALKLVEAWLETSFEGGRHQRRLEKMDQL